MPPQAIDRGIVLDAARAVVLERGVRGARIELIATRAGVSRVTVYRTVGGRHELVQALLLEEANALLAAIATTIDGATTPFDVVRGGVTAALESIDDRPLLRRLATTDLDHMLTHLTTQARELIAAVVDMLAPILEAARVRGALPRGTDVAFLSEELIRYVIGLLHTPTLDGSRTNPTRAGERASLVFAFWLDALAHPGSTDVPKGGALAAVVKG